MGTFDSIVWRNHYHIISVFYIIYLTFTRIIYEIWGLFFFFTNLAFPYFFRTKDMSKMQFKKRRIYEDLGGIRPHGVGYR